MYEARTYREYSNTGRFEFVRIMDEESDLWLGIDIESYNKLDLSLIRAELALLREELKEYIHIKSVFFHSMKPLDVYDDDPAIIKKLKETGTITATGPMTGIAGIIAERICIFILNTFEIMEVIVENGGDICMKISSELNLAISAGENSNFKNLGLKILPSDKVIGICSSSGTFGHSYSFGEADIFTVISTDTTLADAWATSLANRVKTKKDIQTLCNALPENVDALLAIKDDQIAYKGNYELIELN